MAHAQTTNAPISADDFLARARALLPMLTEREAATTARREVPHETIAAYHQAGILRVLQPRAFGGVQGSFLSFSRIVEELATACAASAWVYAVLAEHQWVIACFPEQAQIDVWGSDPLAVASSSLAPRSVARRVDGGYVLNGGFPFSSGSLHAQWAIVGAVTVDDDAARPTRYFLVPMADLCRVDDWRTFGLQGTGSQSLRLDNVFVPAHRAVPLSDLLQGTTPGAALHPDYPLLRAPRDFLTPFSLPPVAFSLGRRVLAMVVDMLRTRHARETLPPSGIDLTRMAVAEASAELATADLLMHTRRAEAVAAVDAGKEISRETILAVRRDVAFAQRHVRQAVERLCDTVGTGFVYDNSPLQALLRDVLTISTHRVWSWQAGMLPYGHWLLGDGAPIT